MGQKIGQRDGFVVLCLLQSYRNTNPAGAEIAPAGSLVIKIAPPIDHTDRQLLTVLIYHIFYAYARGIFRKLLDFCKNHSHRRCVPVAIVGQPFCSPMVTVIFIVTPRR